MSSQRVNPALLSQLRHDGVDPGEARAALSPLSQGLRVMVPRYLHTDGVPLHSVKVLVVGSCRIEKFPPKQLAKEREWWAGVLAYLEGRERNILLASLSETLDAALHSGR